MFMSRRNRSRRRTARAARPEPETARTQQRQRILPTTRFLVWCSAADIRLLDTRAALMQHSAYGLLVLLVAGTGAALVVGFVSTVTGGFRWEFTALGGVWFLLVLALDRSILADSGEDARARSWPSYLLRVGLAVAVGAIVAEAAVLQFFQGEIRAELAERNQTVELTSATTAAAHRRDEQTDAEADADLASLCDLSQEQAALREVTDRWQAEAYGAAGSSGVAGYGPVADGLKVQVDAAQRALDGAGAACADARARVQDRMDAYDAGHGPDLEAAVTQRQEDTGWTTQESALRDALEKRGGDGWFVPALPWLLRAVLFVLDLLPLALKLGMRGSGYHEAVRADADEKRARRRSAAADRARLAEYEARLDLADRMEAADLEALRRSRARRNREGPTP